MTPARRRDTRAGQVYNDLRNLARAQQDDHVVVRDGLEIARPLGAQVRVEGLLLRGHFGEQDDPLRVTRQQVVHRSVEERRQPVPVDAPALTPKT